MKLHYREIGEGPNLLILHGLYACSDNWLSIAKSLKDRHHIILPDCRNHGHSPKVPSHSYQDMSNDILELIDSLGIDKISIIGHSMGGKAGMLFACNHPQRVSELIIIDIAPKTYNTEEYEEHKKRHIGKIKLFESINLSQMTRLTDLLFHLNKLDLSNDDKQLIAKNVYKNTSNKLDWRLNTEIIKTQMDTILGDNLKACDKFNYKCHFIKGEQSDYLKKDDFLNIKEHFPKAIFHIIPNCAHRIHTEQPQKLSSTLRGILKDKEV